MNYLAIAMVELSPLVALVHKLYNEQEELLNRKRLAGKKQSPPPPKTIRKACRRYGVALSLLCKFARTRAYKLQIKEAAIELDRQHEDCKDDHEFETDELTRLLDGLKELELELDNDPSVLSGPLAKKVAKLIHGYEYTLELEMQRACKEEEEFEYENRITSTR